MKTNIVWLRTSYWAGAVVDALAAILLTFPVLMAVVYRLGPIDMSPAFRSVDASAAALMWGWTCLLIWADRKPLERRGVLLLTLLPVLAALILHRLSIILFYQAPFLEELPFLVLQLALAGLFCFSLWINRNDPFIKDTIQ